MKKLNFVFSTKLTFDNYVHDHSIALRCIPPEGETQHILSCELDITPLLATEQTRDAFGNNVTAGYLKKDHRFLDFEVSGIAEIDSSKRRKDFMACYRYQSRLTKQGEKLSEFSRKITGGISDTDVNKRAEFFSEKVYTAMSYVKNCTDVKTTAEDALSQKQGVCQDYSHIMISILRADGIPARYIAGLYSEDGETHAWVEYWTDDGWMGIDPTNNCRVNDSYLVISQGRDYSDCAIDRGVMLGAYTRQMQLVFTKMYS